MFEPGGGGTTLPAPLPILEAVPQRFSRRVARPANTCFHRRRMKNVPSLL
ncbi:hypothetical protein ACLK1T_25980 [Escherichia coli]